MHLSLTSQLERLLEPSYSAFAPEQLAAICRLIGQLDRIERNHDAMYETLLSFPASISDLCPDFDRGVEYCDECGEDEYECCCIPEPCDICGLEECECHEVDDEDECPICLEPESLCCCDDDEEDEDCERD